MLKQIVFFGAFKQFGEALFLDLSENISVLQLKDVLSQELKNRFPKSAAEDLIKSAAVSDGKTILSNSDLIDLKSDIALLPPVCGG